MPKPLTTFHPNAPAKLIRLYLKLGSERAVEQERGVNRKWVHLLLVHGIEPTARANRRALFLKVTPPRDPNQPRPPLPADLAWWRALGKQKRREIITHLFTTTQGD